jgi:glutathione synthase/RimK-type ligase-like ATP-grasp enzyme
MKSVNVTKRVLLVFADSSVKSGQANAALLQEYLQTAADGQSIGMEISYTYASSLSYFVSNGQSRVYDHRNKRDLKDYDFVYFRKVTKVMQQMLACAVYLRQHGIPYFDTEIGASQSRNKLSQMFMFQEKGLPIPATLFSRSRQRTLRLVTEDYASSFPFPVIAKATAGQRGDANYLLTSAEELADLLKREKRHFLVQAYVPSDGDYRALIVFHKLRGLIKRVPMVGSHLSNTSKNGSATWLPLDTLSTHLIDQAILAAQICKRDVAGVDIIINKLTGSPAILEVNRAPQIEDATFPEEKAAVIIQGIEEAMNEPNISITDDIKKSVVGRKEYVEIVELPELGRFVAKIDTGAFSNSLHITRLEEVVDARGRKTLQYSVAADTSVVHETERYFRKIVISSNGSREERFVVEMRIRLGGQELVGNVSLTDRGSMRHPMLIGRRFLRQHKLVVDTARKFHL